MLESLCNKFIGLQNYNFSKKRLSHGCFPMNIVKFFRTPILKNIYKRLILYMLSAAASTNISQAITVISTAQKMKFSIKDLFRFLY